MFSGSVARGGRQLPSQMNDHCCVQGNRNTEQNSAYDLLLCLFIDWGYKPIPLFCASLYIIHMQRPMARKKEPSMNFGVVPRISSTR